MKKNEVFLELIVFLFVILFLYAAGTKLMDYNTFIGQLSKSPLITKYAGTLAWSVPTFEIIVSFLLIIPKFRFVALHAAFAIMITFTFYIIAILSFSTKLPCSCGGILSMLGWKEHLILNIAYVFLALSGIRIMLRGELAKYQKKSISVI